MINGKTKLISVIGNPISHTLSPQIHNKMLNESGLNYVYVPQYVDLNCLAEFVTGIKHTSFLGFNVTVPFKENIIPFLDELDESAASVGAVNTVRIENGKCIGYNTDGKGFIYTIENGLKIDLKGKRVCILGAGGTSRSLGVSLSKQEIRSLHFLNRTLKTAQLVAENCRKKTGVSNCFAMALEESTSIDVLKNADIVVNTTSVGLIKGESPVKDMSWVTNNHVVYDVIYNPFETTILEESKKLGARTINGLAMLVAQAMFAFKIFTGSAASFDLMYEEALKHV